MTTLIIHHHGHDETVTPLRGTPNTFTYRGEDGEVHALRRGEISGVRIPTQEDEK